MRSTVFSTLLFALGGVLFAIVNLPAQSVADRDAAETGKSPADPALLVEQLADSEFEAREKLSLLEH